MGSKIASSFDRHVDHSTEPYNGSMLCKASMSASPMMLPFAPSRRISAFRSNVPSYAHKAAVIKVSDSAQHSNHDSTPPDHHHQHHHSRRTYRDFLLQQHANLLAPSPHFVVHRHLRTTNRTTATRESSQSHRIASQSITIDIAVVNVPKKLPLHSSHPDPTTRVVAARDTTSFESTRRLRAASRSPCASPF